MVAEILNRWCRNIVDWNRVGELLKSDKHKYSNKELVIRSSMIGGTVAGTFIGSRFSFLNEYNTLVRYGIPFIVSFAIIHTIVIFKPLMLKRFYMQKDIDGLVEEIRKTSTSLPIFETNVRLLIEQIVHMEAKNNASSATLGLRKRYLTNLLGHIKLLQENTTTVWSEVCLDMDSITDDGVSKNACLGYPPGSILEGILPHQVVEYQKH